MSPIETSPIVIDTLAWSIASDGVSTYEAAVETVVHAVRLLDIDVPAVDVLADLAAPEIARARAFGIVAAALAARGITSIAGPDFAVAA